MKFLRVLVITILAAMAGCGTKKTLTETGPSTEYLTGWMATAPTVIYKTRGDYSDLVPVIMNETHTRIVSYPDPSDLMSNGKLMKPHQLTKGFLLDNRGINERVAFLNYTYEEYSKLSSPPHMYDLILHIRDRHPLTELYYCGNRSDYSDIVYELNVLIERGLINCKKADLVPMSVIL